MVDATGMARAQVAALMDGAFSIISECLYFVRGGARSFLALYENPGIALEQDYTLWVKGNISETDRSMQARTAPEFDAMRHSIAIAEFPYRLKSSWIACVSLYEEAVHSLANMKPCDSSGYIQCARYVVEIASSLLEFTHAFSNSSQCALDDPNVALKELGDLDESFARTLSTLQRTGILGRFEKEKNDFRQSILGLVREEPLTRAGAD